MHPSLLQAIKEVESLRELAQATPLDKLSKAYEFLLRCERGMRISDNPQDYGQYEHYFDKTFMLLEEYGVVPRGGDV